MGRVSQRGLELVIPPRAADVFGRARPPAGDTARVAHPRLRSEDLVHGELVDPVVAEVVEVAEPIPLLDQAKQLARGLVDEILLVPVRFFYRFAAPRDLEL